ncbi:uncharacterized protein V1513DRAFT_278263 [Lipomyces chichibuensis]|uniref:uncharacterized protein n=1 Tax=Lipomyces chichibuensis TaxID=1546026 RepID=UPI0033434021
MPLRGLFSRRQSFDSSSLQSDCDGIDVTDDRALSPPNLASRPGLGSSSSRYLNTRTPIPCPSGFEAVHTRAGPDGEYGSLTEWPTFKEYNKETTKRIIQSLQNLDRLKINTASRDYYRLGMPSLKLFRRQINYLRVYLLEGAKVPCVGRYLHALKISAEQHAPPAIHTLGHVHYLLDSVPHRLKAREFANSVAERAHERQSTWEYAATSTRVHAICSKDEPSLHYGTIYMRMSAWDPDVILIRATKLSHTWLNTLSRARVLGKKIIILVDCSSSQYDGIVRTISLVIHEWNTTHCVHVSNRIMDSAVIYEKYDRDAVSGVTNIAWAFHPLVVSIFRVDPTVSATFTGFHEYLSIFSYVKHWFAPAITYPAHLDFSIRPPRRIGGNIPTVFWTDEESPIFRMTAAIFDPRTGGQNIHVVGHNGELVLGEMYTLGPDGYDVRGLAIYYDIVVKKIVHIPSYSNRRVVKSGETAVITIIVRKQPPDFHINERNMRRMRITKDYFSLMAHIPRDNLLPKPPWRHPKPESVQEMSLESAIQAPAQRRYTRPPTGVVVIDIDTLSHAQKFAKWNFRRESVISLGLPHGWLYARVLDRHPARNVIVVEFVNKPNFMPPDATFQDLIPYAKFATPAWDVVWTSERVAIAEMHDAAAGEISFAGRIVGVEFVSREIPGFNEFLQRQRGSKMEVLNKEIESSDEN